MQADKDDMPEYLRSRKQEGPWKLAAIMGVGTAIIWGGISLFGKGFIDKANDIKDGQKKSGEIAVEGQTQQKHTARTEAVKQEPYYTQQAWRGDEDVIITNKEADYKKTPATQEKQTTFNDRNYTPTGAVNVVSFNTANWQDEKQDAPIRKQQEIVVVGKQEEKWEQTCSFFGREGSIEKRDCKSRMNLYDRNNGQ